MDLLLHHSLLPHREGSFSSQRKGHPAGWWPLHQWEQDEHVLISQCDNRSTFFRGLRFLLRLPTLCESILDGEDPDYWRAWHMAGILHKYWLDGWMTLPSNACLELRTNMGGRHKTPLPHRCLCLSKLSDPVTEKKLEKCKPEPNISLVHSVSQI